MAQRAVGPCEICAAASGEHYCIDCEQWFCDSCKGLHKRMKTTKHHEFRLSSEAIPEVKTKCKQHNEDFIFLCLDCNILVCRKCASAEHNKHAFSTIDDSVESLKTTTQSEMKGKIGKLRQNVQQAEKSMFSLDREAASVIKMIKEEGERLKNIIDSHINQMVSAVQKEVNRERDLIAKFITGAKEALTNGQSLEKKMQEFQKAREDATLFEQLRQLNDEMKNLHVTDLSRSPSVIYKSKIASENEVKNLLGSYTFSKGETFEAARSSTPQNKERTQSGSTKKKQQRFLYRCEECGNEEIHEYPEELLECDKCGKWTMEFIKTVYE